jgi:HD-GYP domain-containing protein (c-di-GMP phosphodiesterase class II)
LGFNEDDIDTLNVAALLHDYGKLGTDDHILKKPGRLTPDEYEHIKEHVVNTRNILNKMTFSRKYKAVPLLAARHHERLDGSGYAEGLTAAEIPFMSRIIAVADVFEALTAQRHYRGPLSVKEAFEILDQDIGTKFDGNVVRALKSYYKKNHA